MGEQRNIHTQGIILKKHPFGENDFSVTIYSPDLGKIQATAKGARKMTSSAAGYLETLNICNFQLYKSSVRYTIVQCQIQEKFKTIGEDLDRAMMAGMIVEIFNKSTISSEHCSELFHLLRQSLRKIGKTSQHFLTVESFKLNLLRQIGVLPDLENCASCHERWNTGHIIWLEKSGYLRCENCLYEHAVSEQNGHSRNTKNAKHIEFNIIKLINYLIRPLSEQTKTIAFNPEQKEQLQYLTRFFLEHFLDREIVSEKMMMDISG